MVRADIDKHERELARLGKQRTWLEGRASEIDGSRCTSE